MVAQSPNQSKGNLTENEISGYLLDLFIKIHSQLGPGLLESVYEEIICYELQRNNILFTRQEKIPVVYDSVQLEMGFRADIIVDNKVLIELKSVAKITPVHYDQVLTYLKLTGLKLGILTNFNVNLMKFGFHRVVNKL